MFLVVIQSGFTDFCSTDVCGREFKATKEHFPKFVRSSRRASGVN